MNFLKHPGITFIVYLCLLSFQQPAISADENIAPVTTQSSLYNNTIEEFRKVADQEVKKFKTYAVSNPDKLNDHYYKSYSSLNYSYSSAQDKVVKSYDEKHKKLKEEELNFMSAFMNAINNEQESLEAFKTGNENLDIAVENYKAKQKEFEKKINNSSVIENLAIIANPEIPENNPLIDEIKKLTKIFDESNIHPDPMVRYGIMMQAIAEDKAERKAFKQLTERYKATYALSTIREESINKIKQIKENVK